MSLLFELAKECRLDEAIKSMFAGEEINETENRAVLHTALRNRGNEKLETGGKDIRQDIHNELKKMEIFPIK